jgi:hypothetical protein
MVLTSEWMMVPFDWPYTIMKKYAVKINGSNALMYQFIIKVELVSFRGRPVPIGTSRMIG